MISMRSSGSGRLAFGMNALMALVRSLVELQIGQKVVSQRLDFLREQPMAKRTMRRSEYSLWARA